MKNFKTTGIFAALVVAFLAYVYFVEYKGKKEQEELKAEQSKILNYKLEDVKGFVLSRGVYRLAIGKSQEGDWTITSPYLDLADKQIVESFLNAVLEEKTEATVAEGNQIDWNIYGLNAAQATLEVKFNNDRTDIIFLGSTEAVGGKRYIRKNDESKVLLVTSALEDQMKKEPKEFRNKEILRISKDQVVKVKIEPIKGKPITVTKTNGNWVMEGPYSEDTDPTEVSNFISDFAGVTAENFISEDKKSVKGGELTHKAKVFLADGKSIDLEVRKSKDNKFQLTRGDRETVFEINQRFYDLFAKKEEDLRDKKRPFIFEEALVSQIDYKSDIVDLSLKKDGDKWTSPKGNADPDKVNDLITKLKELKVQKFYGKTDSKMYNPKGFITLKDQAGQVLFDFKWGNEDSKNNVTVVKTNKHEELFGVSKEIIPGLPGQTLIQAESKNENDKGQSN